MSKVKHFISADLDEQMTWEFLLDAWRDCPHCSANWRMHEIRHYMALWGDGQIYCNNCNEYLGLWENNKGGIVEWNLREKIGTPTS